MGTTVATNALLERNGEETVLLITKGFKDLLFIGNQARPNIFDIEIVSPSVLYSHIIEVEERVTLVSNPDKTDSVVKGLTGEWVKIIKKLDIELLKKQLQQVPKHIKSVAICLLHSYTFLDHELEIEKLCKKIGFDHIALSSQTSPMIKVVPRGTSTSADAYLTPCIKAYLNSFFAGFDDNIHKTVKVEFMQSDGGLVNVNKFNGFRAILSGPAGFLLSDL